MDGETDVRSKGVQHQRVYNVQVRAADSVR